MKTRTNKTMVTSACTFDTRNVDSAFLLNWRIKKGFARLKCERRGRSEVLLGGASCLSLSGNSLIV